MELSEPYSLSEKKGLVNPLLILGKEMVIFCFIKPKVSVGLTAIYFTSSALTINLFRFVPIGQQVANVSVGLLALANILASSAEVLNLSLTL